MNNSSTALEVKYLQEIYDNRKYHFWYGGDVVEIIYNKNIKFVIAAIGDVIGDLYKNQECILCFKDKNNNGYFLDTVGDYIKDDSELEKYMTYDYVDDEYLKDNKDKEFIVYFSNNNWWEVFPIVNGEYVDIMYCLNSYSIEEAIDEVISNTEFILDSI